MQLIRGIIALILVLLCALPLLVLAQTPTVAPTASPTKKPTTTPTSNPSTTPTTKSPTTPTKSPTYGCGAADKTLWETKYYWSFTTYMDKCGKKSAGDRTTAKTCLADYQKGLTESCATCFVDLIVCTRDNCLAPCINDGQKNPLCVSCVLEFCDTTFTACSTFYTQKCDGCKEVTSAPTLAAGISNEAIYGIIGGGVALIIIAGILIWRFKCCVNGHHVADAEPPAPSLGSPSSSQNNIKPSLAPSLPSGSSNPQLMAQMSPYMMPQQQQFMMQPGQQQYMMQPTQQQQYMMMPPGQQFVLTPQGYMMVPQGSFQQQPQ